MAEPEIETGTVVSRWTRSWADCRTMGKSEPEAETMGISTQRQLWPLRAHLCLHQDQGQAGVMKGVKVKGNEDSFYSKATVQKAFSTSKKVLNLKETKCELFTQE